MTKRVSGSQGGYEWGENFTSSAIEDFCLKRGVPCCWKHLFLPHLFKVPPGHWGGGKPEPVRTVLKWAGNTKKSRLKTYLVSLICPSVFTIQNSTTPGYTHLMLFQKDPICHQRGTEWRKETSPFDQEQKGEAMGQTNISKSKCGTKFNKLETNIKKGEHTKTNIMLSFLHKKIKMSNVKQK